MNKLYSEMTSNQTQQMNPIKRLMNTIKFATNPNQALADAINSNPQMAQLLLAMKQSGKNPKDLFYELAKQKGVDPEEILKQLR